MTTTTTTAAWTPRHARLLAALDAEVLLPAARRALRLPASSERADRALIEALQGDPALRAALRLLERGDETALAREVTARFPARLSAPVVHHLALAWRRHAADEALRREGLRGLVWLLDVRRGESGGYLLGIAQAALGPGSRLAEAEAVLDEVFATLWADELAALRAVGSSAQDLARAQLARERLGAVVEAARQDGVSAGRLARLEGLWHEAASAGAEHVMARVLTAAGEAERRRVAGERGHLGTVFAEALLAVGVLGHHELLSIEVVDKAVELAWPLYQGKEYASVLALLEPVEVFVDDLGHRLASDEAFGRQSIFADYYVMRAQSLDPGTGAHREPVLREQRRLLERGFAVCPIHRNTRVCLATADLALAALLLDEARRGWRPGGREQRLAEAATLVREAETLRPDHSRLAEVRALLESVRGT